MRVNYTGKVGHGTVTHFYITSTENFIQLMRFCKMFIQQQQKLLTNLGGYITAVWGGVEPYNISFSVFITGANIFFSEWLKLDFMVKSTA